MENQSRSRKAAGPREEAECCDIVVAGGGYVGLCAALAIRSAAPGLDVVVADAQPASAIEADTRASAIAQAAVRMLDRLGIWQEVLGEAQPIREMIVTDSRTGDAVRPVFLTFSEEGEAATTRGVRGGGVRGEGEGRKPFAHMLPNRALVKSLRARAEEAGVRLIYGDAVRSFDSQPESIEVSFASGRKLAARLLVAADGVRSALREQAGIRTVHWPYGQSAIVLTVRHERDHEGRAEEHFLPAGPFAILPLPGRRSSLVWTESTQDAERLMAADDITFELELERRFGHKLGEISVEGPRKCFPLGLTLAREFVRPRLALAGDAAHGVHPIAGQGLNLGFKDAAALAETIVEAHRLGLDIGSLAVLERYQMWRRFDTVRMGVTTDVLNRMFSNDNALVRVARDFGLAAVDRMPPLKRWFIDQAAGRGGGQPRLLSGEAI
jgi:2-octaprenyl-6-methoxyphenol hydroxylase